MGFEIYHNESKINITERIWHSLHWACVLCFLVYVSRASFSGRVRRLIKNEAQGCCDNCGMHVGYENLIAAHINHQKGAQYNSRENGRAHCNVCEAEYHLMYADQPRVIGLEFSQNDPVAYGHVNSLPTKDRDILIQRYPEVWKNLLERMNAKV